MLILQEDERQLAEKEKKRKKGKRSQKEFSIAAQKVYGGKDEASRGREAPTNALKKKPSSSEGPHKHSLSLTQKKEGEQQTKQLSKKAVNAAKRAHERSQSVVREGHEEPNNVISEEEGEESGGSESEEEDDQFSEEEEESGKTIVRNPNEPSDSSSRGATILDGPRRRRGEQRRRDDVEISSTGIRSLAMIYKDLKKEIHEEEKGRSDSGGSNSEPEDDDLSVIKESQYDLGKRA